MRPRCEMQVAVCVMRCVQERTPAKSREESPRGRPSPMPCGNMDAGMRWWVKDETLHPKTQKMLKWEELGREHLLRQVRRVEVDLKDVQHGHITCAFDSEGVARFMCRRTSLRGEFPMLCSRAIFTMGKKALDRTCLVDPVVSEEKWYTDARNPRLRRGMLAKRCLRREVQRPP